MTSYVAFLRGINVGGKNVIKMANLKSVLAATQLSNVRTYIQSGNILCESDDANPDHIAQLIADRIETHFKQPVGVAVFSRAEWQQIVESAPEAWGEDPEWKHNLLIMIKPYDMAEVIAGIGQLKPDIEHLDAGTGVIYQSMSRQLYGRTTTGKLASNPVYRQMTIRNYNTATKLLELI
jgi:uncharacterized protein (DUF1697 family)